MIKNNLLYNIIINFNLATIKLLASDIKEFTKGLELYQNNAITNVALTKVFDSESLEDIVQIKCKIKDENNLYYLVNINIDMQGDLLRYECMCNSARANTYSFCKHIVAVLIYIFYNNVASEGQTRDIFYNNIDNDFMSLVKIYEDKLYNNSTVKLNNSILTLIPKLYNTENNTLELGFSISSSDKSYIVKDVFSLADNIKSSKDFQYGKNFSVNHNINNFDETSKELAKFVMNLCFEYKEMYDYSSDYSPNKKSVRIPNSKINVLFDLLEGKSISFNYNKNSDSIILINSNPEINFYIEKNYNNNRYDFSVNNFFETKNFIYKYINKSYIISGDYFYCCDRTFTENILPALEKIKSTKNLSISISEKNIPKFISTVVSNLRNYTTVDMPEDIVINYEISKLKAKAFLDKNKSNNILLELIYQYGDKEFNPLQPPINGELNNVVRDLEAEFKITSFIKQCGFIEKSKKYVLNNETQIYDFVTSDIDNLIELCDVNISENFKKIKVKLPKTISMGVRLTNNLIELDLDNLEFDVSELKNILAQYNIKKRYYRLKDGSFLRIDEDYYNTIKDLNDDLDIANTKHDGNKFLLPKFRSLNLSNLINNNESIAATKNDKFEQIVNDLAENKSLNIELPKQLGGVLRNYQVSGYKWLKTLAHYGLGGILADDMGLGKTLQVISVLLSEKDCNLPSIVVCPTSLIYNWVSEVEKFAPELSTMVINGSKQQRTDLISNIGDTNLIVTSYDILKRDIEMYKEMQFNYCILDEAQYIKNSYTQNASSVKNIKSNVRFALTGTPIENSLSDLWSIFDFIMPSFLLSYNKFKDRYENPIIKDSDKDMLQKLHTSIEPFILRRLKKDVLKDLPDKIETSSYTKMDEKQRKLYLAELFKVSKEYEQEVATQGFERSQIKILALITRLRQICCHPSLFIENYNGESAKLNLCMQIVHDSIESNHKILIFSQFTSMLDIIAKNFEEKGIAYYMLTGSTKSQDRMALINKFNEDDTPVFLISLKAGGTGLNLTGADIVIHFDPWWNNSAQNQATDRAHRIGQKNKVQVYKLITKDTIEEKIEKLQSQKQSLVDSVITEKEVMFNSLTKEEVKNLFSI